jgi:hypothetical protein
MTDMGTMILQNCMGLGKNVAGSCREACPTYPHVANHVASIKVPNSSNIAEEEDDPMPLGFAAVKVEHEVSCIKVLR